MIIKNMFSKPIDRDIKGVIKVGQDDDANIKQELEEYVVTRELDELANSLQVCLDSGAKKVLLPIVSAADIGAVPSDLIGCFNLIFYSSAEDAVYKALGVE